MKMTHSRRIQFLYVLLKEYDLSAIDTTLRILYWPEENDAQFLIYGHRRDLKIGTYTPYRLVCRKIEHVSRFIQTIFSKSSLITMELHQFDGLNSEYDFDIQWENTAENHSTEITAYDKLELHNLNRNLREFLTTLRNVEVFTENY
jgi:hypothetical protein